MNTKNIERYLDSFGKYVVKQSRTNLTKGKKNVNKSLYNSISFKVEPSADGFSVEFYMNSYGTFVDKGVSGNKKRQTYRDYKGKTIVSPYKYTNKQPPSGIMDKWVVKKGIAPRDEKGRFITRKSISFLIARSIKARGIKSTSFFQRPLELGLKTFSSDFLEAIREDIIEGLTTVK
jgi:hypothetical protein|tara:strand:- start:4952 stop:5479 length:528 start_codon:yes stop_codon:yes gene_type:complete